MLDTHDREAIARLSSQRPYVLLLEEIQDGIHDILAAMYQAKDDGQVLKLARLWQVHYHYWTVLRDNPDKIKNELSREMEEIRKMKYEVADPQAPPFSKGRAAFLEAIENIAGDEPRKNTMEFPL